MSSNTTSSTTNPSKASGQFHSTKGNVKEGLGNLTGSTSLQQSGREERMAGDAEVKGAQTKGYAEGTTDRIGGKKDSIVGSVTGDRSQQVQGDVRQSKGEALQDVNKNY